MRKLAKGERMTVCRVKDSLAVSVVSVSVSLAFRAH